LKFHSEKESKNPINKQAVYKTCLRFTAKQNPENKASGNKRGPASASMAHYCET
jgi:hypothetical protein